MDGGKLSAAFFKRRTDPADGSGKGRMDADSKFREKDTNGTIMTMQRSRLSKLMSVFDAGDCPTQPGIDITETGFGTGR